MAHTHLLIHRVPLPLSYSNVIERVGHLINGYNQDFIAFSPENSTGVCKTLETENTFLFPSFHFILHKLTFILIILHSTVFSVALTYFIRPLLKFKHSYNNNMSDLTVEYKIYKILHFSETLLLIITPKILQQYIQFTLIDSSVSKSNFNTLL